MPSVPARARPTPSVLGLVRPTDRQHRPRPVTRVPSEPPGDLHALQQCYRDRRRQRLEHRHEHSAIVVVRHRLVLGLQWLMIHPDIDPLICHYQVKCKLAMLCRHS